VLLTRATPASYVSATVHPVTTQSELLRLADERFVSLTTFRKTGEEVSTPVWIARDGHDLLVTTPDDTGKVKRLRNSTRARLSPSSRMGKVADDAVAVDADATIEPETERLTQIFREKYGFEYRLFMWIERRGSKGQKPRVILRITA
jgi:PPOX class probable F420-dependent enzyme